MAHRAPRFFARRGAPTHRLKYPAAAFERGYVCLREHFDIRESGDAVDQIARHFRGQARPAHQEPDLLHLARQINHRLAGRISGADQRHLLARAQLCLERRGPIVHARAFECREAFDGRPPVAYAARDHHRARSRALAIRQFEPKAAVVREGGRIKRDRLVRDRRLDPELLRLTVGARHQRHAADAGRKTEVILDARRGAGLPAKCAAIENERAQVLPSRRRPRPQAPPGRRPRSPRRRCGRGRSGRQARCTAQARPRPDCAAAGRPGTERSAIDRDRREIARSAPWLPASVSGSS